MPSYASIRDYARSMGIKVGARVVSLLADLYVSTLATIIKHNTSRQVTVDTLVDSLSKMGVSGSYKLVYKVCPRFDKGTRDYSSRSEYNSARDLFYKAQTDCSYIKHSTFKKMLGRVYDITGEKQMEDTVVLQLHVLTDAVFRRFLKALKETGASDVDTSTITSVYSRVIKKPLLLENVSIKTRKRLTQGTHGTQVEGNVGTQGTQTQGTEVENNVGTQTQGTEVENNVGTQGTQTQGTEVEGNVGTQVTEVENNVGTQTQSLQGTQGDVEDEATRRKLAETKAKLENGIQEVEKDVQRRLMETKGKLERGIQEVENSARGKLRGARARLEGDNNGTTGDNKSNSGKKKYSQIDMDGDDYFWEDYYKVGPREGETSDDQYWRRYYGAGVRVPEDPAKPNRPKRPPPPPPPPPPAYPYAYPHYTVQQPMSTIQPTTQDIEYLRSVLKTQELTIEDMRARSASMKREIEAMRSDDNARVKLDEYKVLYRETKDKLEEAKKKISRLKEKHEREKERSEREKERIQRECERKLERNESDCESKLDRMRSRGTPGERDRDVDTYNTLIRELSEARETITKMKAEQSQMRGVRSQTETGQLDTLEREIDEYISVINELRRENKGLKEKSDTCDSELQRLRAKLEECESGLRKLSTEKDALIRGASDLQDQINESMELIEELKVERDSYIVTGKEFQDRTTRAEAELQRTKRMKELQYSTLQKEIEYQKDLVSKKDAEIEEVRKRVDGLSGDNEKRLRNRIANLEQKIAVSNETYMRNKREIEQKEAELKQREEEHRVIKGQLEECRKKMREYISKTDRIHTLQLKQKDKLIEKAQADRKRQLYEDTPGTQSKVKQLKNELEKSRREAGLYKANYELAAKQLEEANDQLEELTKRKREGTGENTGSYEEKNMQLKNELENCRKELASYKYRYELCAKQLKKVNGKLETELNKQRELMDAKMKLESELDESTRQVSLNKANYELAKTQIEEAKSQLQSELDRQKELFGRELDACRRQVSILKADYKLCGQQLEEANERLQSELSEQKKLLEQKEGLEGELNECGRRLSIYKGNYELCARQLEEANVQLTNEVNRQVDSNAVIEQTIQGLLEKNRGLGVELVESRRQLSIYKANYELCAKQLEELNDQMDVQNTENDYDTEITDAE
ncbi:hypothetical protein EBZ38_04980 [bacterium]|nr:hypothetical protein [bacterium]